MHSGGYLRSKKVKLPLYANKHENQRIEFQWSQSYVQRLNRVQQTPYYLDRKKIDWALATYYKSLMHSLDEVLAKAEETSDRNPTRRVDFNANWKAVRTVGWKLVELFNDLRTIDYLEGFSDPSRGVLTLYYPLSVDRVGRMYRTGPLNITNSKFFRVRRRGWPKALGRQIAKVGDMDVHSWIALTRKEADLGTKGYLMSAYSRRLKPGAPDRCFVDATSSMIQIYSLLFADYEMALFSNLGGLEQSDATLHLKKRFAGAAAAFPAGARDLLDQRGFLKAFVMITRYGAVTNAFEDLCSKWIHQRGHKTTDWAESDCETTAYGNMRKFRRARKDLVTAEFREYFDFATEATKYFNDVTLRWQGNEARYHFCRSKKRTIEIPAPAGAEEGRQRCVLWLPDQEKVNHRKTKRTVLTGMIHSLDAEVALKVCDKMLKEGFRCYSIHDCFGCESEGLSLLLKIYKSVL